MERPDVTPWLLGLRRDLTHGDATSQVPGAGYRV